MVHGPGRAASTQAWLPQQWGQLTVGEVALASAQLSKGRQLPKGRVGGRLAGIPEMGQAHPLLTAWAAADRAGPHQRGGEAAPQGGGEPALPSSLAPGPGGGGGGQAHGNLLEWPIQGSGELGEAAVPSQLSSFCHGCCSGYSRNILAVLWALTENRGAGRVLGSGGKPWAGHCSALMTGGQRQAQMAQPTGCSPACRAERRLSLADAQAWMTCLPLPDRTNISRGSSSQAFSRSQWFSQLCKSKSSQQPVSGRARPAGRHGARWAVWAELLQALLCLKSCGLGHPRGSHCLPPR